jgi:hypothetical protein
MKAHDDAVALAQACANDGAALRYLLAQDTDWPTVCW